MNFYTAILEFENGGVGILNSNRTAGGRVLRCGGSSIKKTYMAGNYSLFHFQVLPHTFNLANLGYFKNSFNPLCATLFSLVIFSALWINILFVRCIHG